MRASIPTWSSGLTTAGASRSPRGTASRSTSTRCCARGWSRTASRAPTRSTRPTRCRGRVLERVHDAALLARIRARRAERARGARARAAVVAGARRARPARRSAGRSRAARRALEHGDRHEPRRRHPPRGPRLRARLLPVQRRRRRARRSCAPRSSPSARWSSTATSTRATAPPTCSAPIRDAFTLSLHGARNYPFQRIPSDLDVDLPTGTGDDDYLEALSGALDVALGAAARPTSRSTSPAPTRGRATASAGSRSPRPACARATSSSSTACGAGAPVVRRARRRLRAGRPRHRRHQRGDRRRGRAPEAMEARGIEPLPQPCKGRVLPLSLRPRSEPQDDTEVQGSAGGLELRDRQPLLRRSPPTGSGSRDDIREVMRSLVPRGAGPGPGQARRRARSTSSRGYPRPAQRRARARTRAASATTRRSTSTRCARSPR